MIYYLYAIRDKYRGFMQPAMDVDDNAAKREFSFAINNNPGIMNFNPADFDFYKIGEFDNASGEVKSIVPEFICNGVNVFNEKQEC